ncbi:C-C motif chemokine 23 isoform X2 [Dasypus novemcinctus]|uniref:C-C motif chemokine 23 isoform X2 n=1 Tax=Dasypus novemcinctus TaxID=9361 RepID=UPI000328C0D6|nr:C-C motif chemokine 23 isoform X2 [Dasypus novemcinctus]
MKVSAAALSVLILAATLGAQARVIHEARGSKWEVVPFDPVPIEESLLYPSDCCFYYTSRTIRCSAIKDYFETSSGCSQPGVIFLTKRGKRVCANPSNKHIQECMMNLKLDTKTTKKSQRMDLV